MAMDPATQDVAREGQGVRVPPMASGGAGRPPRNEPPAPTGVPEAKAAVLSKAPSSDRKFPCKACGAKLDFDPSQRSLKCPYCGHEEKIEPSRQGVQELDYQAYLSKQAGDGGAIEGRSTEVKCAGCGAVVLLEDKVATDKCPFCGTHLESAGSQGAQGQIRPECILPFALTSRQAMDAFNQWIAGRWFAPGDLKALANMGQLSGVYIPYWTYDSMTYTHYEGQRGEDYTETEYYTETDAEGKTVQRSRQVTKTRWYYVSGEVDHFFNDVLVCASRSLPGDMIGRLQQWDLPDLEGFRPEFLSGFKTERYAVGLGEGFGVAQQMMDPQIRRMCEQDIGGDHQRLLEVKTQHVGVTFKHLLLPIWLAVYRYKDQPYRILVNARTGEVVGSRPYSWGKIALLVVAIVIVLLIVMLVISSEMAQRGSGQMHYGYGSQF